MQRVCLLGDVSAYRSGREGGNLPTTMAIVNVTSSQDERTEMLVYPRDSRRKGMTGL
jgi:hypothetical protein